METEKKKAKKSLRIKIPFIKQELAIKKLFILSFISSAARGERSYGKYPDKLINTVKVFITATRKFLEDQCLTKAASITYAIMVSLIPTLTVILTGSSFLKGKDARKDEVFRAISSFMAEHSIRLNVEPLFAAISSLIENAGKIGGISAIVMLFTATAMLRTLESSLNNIWKVQQQRRLLMKIVYYWAALTLGPIIFISAGTLATSLSAAFSAPAYTSAEYAGSKIWVAGSKSSLMYSNTGGASGVPKSRDFNTVNAAAVDFDNQILYAFDASEKTFIPAEGTEYNYSETVFSDIQFIEDNGWAAGNQGIILYTYNAGKNWSLKKWGNISFNDIHMLNKNDGFIAADGGLIFSTNDGGQSWQMLGHDIMANFTSIRFRNKTGIITGSNGTILRTNDGGKSWNAEKINAAKLNKQSVSLNNSFFVSNEIIWLVGSGGVLLKSQDSGRSWESIVLKNFNYTDAYFFNKDEGVAAGSRGRIISTLDGGENWNISHLPTSKINSFFEKDGFLWALGDKGLVMISADKGKTWDGIESSDFLGFLINFLTPFIFIWVFFFLCYIMMPNTKVPFKEAAIGSSFTGAVWVVFILLFIVYIQSFAKGTIAIYGALASIPLFLLMIYASAIIILYGAEVSYTLMHPEIYANIYRELNDRHEIHIYYGISIICHIYQKFEAGKGGADYKELSKLCTYNSEEVDFFLKKFMHDKVILHDHNMGYIPANSSQNIPVAGIIDSINSMSLVVPKGVKKSHLRDYMEELLKTMEQNRKGIVGNATLADLIK
ncbi:MAG: YihY/virulence factor BrkB family protein [Spirochaetia bacterium]|jgi:membrane protein|nr:YihY/virulence factor BrkB family protein [Spirochaetia bacterium]